MDFPGVHQVQLLLVVFWGLGGLEAVAGADNVLCYERFEVNTGICTELLGDGVTQNDCCLNSQYGFRLHKDAPCEACRSAEWSQWSPWSPCSVSCTEGTQRRKRTCHGQGNCEGGPKQWEMQTCSHKDCCPVMGGWSAWSAWSSCSVTCAQGFRSRQRTCTNPVPICEGICPGISTERETCNTQVVCPTHGNWGGWGSWGACSAPCTPEGSVQKPTQTRRRQCNNPPPSSNPRGNACSGKDIASQVCPGLPYCALDGSWGSWMPLSLCSVTCGVGRLMQKRLCDSPAPKHGGKPCPGLDTRSSVCSIKVPCPVDGRWTEWGEWAPCMRASVSSADSIDCQDIPGLQRRTRRCIGWAHEGNRCNGPRVEMRHCYSAQGCRWTGVWSEWSSWSRCEPPCGDRPMKSRKKECRAVYPNFDMTAEGVGDSGSVFNITFWGKPQPRCTESLEGQWKELVNTVPCQNILPCED